MKAAWLRTVDLLFTVLLAPVWLPLLLLGVLLAVLGQGLPVFYLATRVGRNGAPFTMLKIRSMARGADRRGPQVSSCTDSRVTPVGKIIRKAKLDELPQFLHVLKGDMSIVGPRPESPAYLPHYDENGRRSLAVKPGVTGPGAIFFLFRDSGDGQDFEARYIRELLPIKLRLDADCSDRLREKPFRTTAAFVGWTLVAVLYRILLHHPPKTVDAWEGTGTKRD